jgi:hypothetical protein
VIACGDQRDMDAGTPTLMRRRFRHPFPFLGPEFSGSA